MKKIGAILLFPIFLFSQPSRCAQRLDVMKMRKLNASATKGLCGYALMNLGENCRVRFESAAYILIVKRN